VLDFVVYILKDIGIMDHYHVIFCAVPKTVIKNLQQPRWSAAASSDDCILIQLIDAKFRWLDKSVYLSTTSTNLS